MIDTVLEIKVDIADGLPRWRELCRALWYARGAVMSVRRFAGRARARRRPAWRWRGGSGVPYPRATDVSRLLDLATGSVFGFVERPNWRALAVWASQRQSTIPTWAHGHRWVQ
jgi:hypothetical protein